MSKERGRPPDRYDSPLAANSPFIYPSPFRDTLDTFQRIRVFGSRHAALTTLIADLVCCYCLRMSTRAVVLAVLVLCTSCSHVCEETFDVVTGTEPTDIECPDDQLLVSGTVSQAASDVSRPFVADPDAHVWMRISQVVLDWAGETRASRDAPFESLPFKFALCGNPADVRPVDDVSVTVFNHRGAVEMVGDLASEGFTFIDGPGDSVQIELVTVRSCDHPAPSGACSECEP